MGISQNGKFTILISLFLCVFENIHNKLKYNIFLNATTKSVTTSPSLALSSSLGSVLSEVISFLWQ